MGRKGDLGRGRGAGGPANRGKGERGGSEVYDSPSRSLHSQDHLEKSIGGTFPESKVCQVSLIKAPPESRESVLLACRGTARCQTRLPTPPPSPPALLSAPPQVHKPCLGASSGVAAWAALSLGFLADADTQKAGKQKAR